MFVGYVIIGIIESFVFTDEVTPDVAVIPILFLFFAAAYVLLLF